MFVATFDFLIDCGRAVDLALGTSNPALLQQPLGSFFEFESTMTSPQDNIPQPIFMYHAEAANT